MAMTLQHPFDEHALIRRQLSDHCSLWCNICYCEVFGLAYCCEEDGCSFLLHESCALVEFPQKIIKHPFHPYHPLHIESRQYCCQFCNIKLDPLVVIATLPPLEEEKVIQHVAHVHSPTTFHVKAPCWVKCQACGDRVSGLAYGCRGCSFFLHETCSQLPREMLQHPFHPEHPLTLFRMIDNLQCKACDIKTFDQLAYHCQECGFELDVTCAVLLLRLQDQQKEDSVLLDHFSHQHPLLSGHVEESKHIKLRCAVCELEISGEVYYCLACIFVVHKLCTEELLKEMVHYLHPEHPLILSSEPGGFECSCCCGYIISGMVFECESCEFDLHPKCALQTLSAFRDGVHSKIQHFGHEHPLMLRYFKDETNNECKACLKHIIGLAYFCYDCRYALHKSCVELPSQLEHPLHRPHPLILLPRTPDEYFICDNCCQGSQGFAFCCSLCDFYMCKACATEMPTLKHQLHEHTLAHFQSWGEQKSQRCYVCRRPCRFDFYRCTPCNFNLHSSCMPLPPTIQHKCHERHPLVLFDRFVDGRPDDQYCDYCEEIRNPEHGVYLCEECPYTVHIGCVLPQVAQPANPSLNKLRKEIKIMKRTIKEKEKDLKALKEELSRLEINLRSELLEGEEG